MEKICGRCGKKYVADRYKQKFCSNDCAVFQKGNVPWNKGETGYMLRAHAERNIARLVNYIKNETDEQKFHRLRGLRNGPKSRGRLGKTGDKDPLWKGEEANYNSKHKWIQKHWEKLGTCQECGSKPIPNPLKRLKKATYWHNPSKTYRRERSEWMEVCARCHYQLDKKS